jgi:hypothetical protein
MGIPALSILTHFASTIPPSTVCIYMDVALIIFPSSITLHDIPPRSLENTYSYTRPNRLPRKCDALPYVGHGPHSTKVGIDDEDDDNDNEEEDDDAASRGNDSNARSSVDSQASAEDVETMMEGNGAEDEDEDDEEEEEEAEEEEEEDEEEDEGGRDEVRSDGNKAGGDVFEASLLLNIGTSSPETDSAASMPNQNRKIGAEGGDVVVAPTASANNNNNLETDRLLREQGGSGGGFDANGANNPNTLPTSMTSFLDQSAQLDPRLIC